MCPAATRGPRWRSELHLLKPLHPEETIGPVSGHIHPVDAALRRERSVAATGNNRSSSALVLCCNTCSCSCSSSRSSSSNSTSSCCKALVLVIIFIVQNGVFWDVLQLLVTANVVPSSLILSIQLVFLRRVL
jgi:hypothetical protein